MPLDQTEVFYLCKQSRLNHKLDPHPIFQHDNLSKVCSLWSIGAKGGENVVHKDRTQRRTSTKKMLFTKIDPIGEKMIKEGDQLKF